METVLIILSLILLQPAGVQTPAPLSITLNDFDYPYPVKYYPVTVEEKVCRMAYMDIGPQHNPNGKVDYR